ncbi:rhomboid family intramembrane serine protease [Methylocystis parvus]|uniref:Rhomboid family intramembrane serine protease n=1 Tax=Methylocystis parvus TaxID=134 RepID=A0A6B8M046_9HYPH|nr:rhomboid family intramembrane serine protease [Methylocystis parvus]QGM97094.1 rhomboid family intramembrane serine protease [Methylocystis parvus]WBJ99003.1 rhomboid family intramembrane serine protease [Methylocystis parvus OBBP]
MVMPLYDDAPLRHLKRPVANHALIVVNIAVFLLVQSEILGDPLTVMRGFAIIPRVLFGEASLADWIVGPPPALTLVTSLFFHSSLLHLASNLLFLYVFGDNVEDAMGSLHYVLFYLSCGVMSGVFYVYATPQSITPLVGASGAISGVCAAFLLLYPGATVTGFFPPLTMVMLPFWFITLADKSRPPLRRLLGLTPPLFSFHATGFLFVGAWIALQLVNASWGGGETHVAWMAHVGGIVAGLLLTPLFKRRRHKLLDRGPYGPPKAPPATEPAPPEQTGFDG